MLFIMQHDILMYLTWLTHFRIVYVVLVAKVIYIISLILAPVPIKMIKPKKR